MARRPLVFLCAAMVLLFVLATSVGGIVFAPGRPLDLTVPPTSSESPVENSGLFLLILRVIFSLMLILLPFALIHAMTSREGRRRLLKLAILIALVFLLVKNMDSRPPMPRIRQNQSIAAPPKEVEPSEAVANPTDPSIEIMSIVASLLIALAIVGFVVWLIRRRQDESAITSDENDLALTATEAAGAIRRGEDIEEVIQRCYVRMCEVIQSEHGVERPVSMTPSAFQAVLRERNVPDEASRTLTTLFEHIRYGGFVANTDQQHQAIDSLEAIAAAVNSSRDPDRQLDGAPQ